jgi:hypothetical protein
MSYPFPVSAGGGLSPYLVEIGDIRCTADEVITPVGRRPIRSVSWEFQDLSRTVRLTPPWAVTFAVLGAVLALPLMLLFLPLGIASGLCLLFLLARETRTTGWVVVGVQGHGLNHRIQLPVGAPGQVADLGARVNQAHSLSDLY